MGVRVSALVLIALIGFIVGAVVPVAAENIPIEYLSYLAMMIQIRWVLSGIAGSILAVIFALIIARSTGKKRF